MSLQDREDCTEKKAYPSYGEKILEKKRTPLLVWMNLQMRRWQIELCKNELIDLYNKNQDKIGVIEYREISHMYFSATISYNGNSSNNSND